MISLFYPTLNIALKFTTRVKCPKLIQQWDGGREGKEEWDGGLRQAGRQEDRYSLGEAINSSNTGTVCGGPISGRAVNLILLPHWQSRVPHGSLALRLLYKEFYSALAFHPQNTPFSLSQPMQIHNWLDMDKYFKTIIIKPNIELQSKAQHWACQYVAQNGQVLFWVQYVLCKAQNKTFATYVSEFKFGMLEKAA